MTDSDWKIKLYDLISKNSSGVREIRRALEKWGSYASGEFDVRSGAKAVEVFENVAHESPEGRLVLVLIFYELFLEFGEFPRKSLFDNDFLVEIRNIPENLGGEEKKIFDWFLAELQQNR